ncbi:hypothetical protein AC578_6468 [Pseudocercospora eumusae]|uniref:Uncharacterized protein n=1 Tax=Pseudocercospora eumusae TaxID=321146 RepID=A0A139HD01_9PEZI|nr:hypothetical protein AC578_6468 [Pseudocercospora eumusae]
MSDFSRDSSPDPIILPSSPLSGRKAGNVRSTRQSSPAKRNARASPSKSMILDTPHAGEASPWRIKVTVQAEPRDGSPGKKTTKTMTVPLESPTKGRRSSSPTKKPTPKKPTPAKKRGRKRKASPIKEQRSAPPLRVQEEVQSESDQEPAIVDDVLPPPSQTPPRRASGRLARLSAQWSNGTGRTKRLSMAREELDQALQDAMGPGGEGLGDMTLNRAEDFTMLTLESLQSAKEASLAHTSQLNAEPSQLGRSGLNVSYFPSSPPKNQYPDISATAARARSSLGSPFEPTPSKRTSLSVPFSTKSSAKGKSSLRHDVDAMSWKPTGLAKLRPSSSAEEVRPAQDLDHQWQEQRQAVSQQILNADPGDVVVVNDDGDESGDDLNGANDIQEDLWQDEASRPATGNPSNDEREERVDPDFRPTHSPSEAEDPNYKPPSSQKRSQKFEDLFAHLPEKPLRPKIPRTWRRSSGMDFSYVDSPAHQPPAETVEHRRQSADGSGVLTPPSTDESEQEAEDNVTADLQSEADDQLQSEYTQPEQEDEEDEVDSGELQHEVDDQLQSEFTQPEAEATRFHQDDYDDHEMIDDEEEHSRNDSKDPLDESTAGEATTMPDRPDLGESFATNPSQAHLKEKPKRGRPARKPTMDLDELLGLKSSPQKAPPPQPPSQHSSTKRKSSPVQLSSSSKMKNAQGSTSLSESAFNSIRTDDLLTNPPTSRHLQELRDSGVKHFSESGQYPIVEPVKAQPPAEQAQPKRRGRQYFGRNHPNHTQSTVTDSFASTGSVQQPVHSQVQILIQEAQSPLRSQDTTQALPKPAVVLAHEKSTSSRDVANGRQPSQHAPTYVKPRPARYHEVVEAGESFESNQQQSQMLHADTYEEDEDEDETADPTRSYQENLNLDSPTKIKINFGDSSTRDASWLNTANRRPPLFETQASAQYTRPLAQTESRSQPSKPQPDSNSAIVTNIKSTTTALLSHIGTTLWSTLNRPAHQPTESIPTLHPKPYEPPIPSPTTLRSRIRSRYGVLPDSHPWTMAHMRTLHRMLNSTMSRRPDSMIPKHGPLPHVLERQISVSPQTSIAGYRFSFTKSHAYTVFAFLHTLVPEHTIDGDGDVLLGDEVARRCRGFYDPARHGDDVVYSEEEVRVEGKICVEFVVRALGDCVKANDVLRERERGE